MKLSNREWGKCFEWRWDLVLPSRDIDLWSGFQASLKFWGAERSEVWGGLSFEAEQHPLRTLVSGAEVDCSFNKGLSVGCVTGWTSTRVSRQKAQPRAKYNQEQTRRVVRGGKCGGLSLRAGDPGVPQ